MVTGWASLKSLTPHLHWHVIPRFADDKHFPDPVWAAAQRAGRTHPVDAVRLTQVVARHLANAI